MIKIEGIWHITPVGVKGLWTVYDVTSVIFSVSNMPLFGTSTTLIFFVSEKGGKPVGFCPSLGSLNIDFAKQAAASVRSSKLDAANVA